MFFALIALSSDLICFLFIPIHWLFFAASTYVWVQYVWHTDRGICLPTISLWLLFVYIEASVRLKELKSPYNLDLCRPFAAHCIGYPVVTLGFGFKSYVSYRLRLRKQREVEKENQFYKQLLEQALPQESLVTLSTSVNDTNCVNNDVNCNSNQISSIIGTSTVITNGVHVNESNGHHNHHHHHQSQSHHVHNREALSTANNSQSSSSCTSISSKNNVNSVITPSSPTTGHHVDINSSSNCAVYSSTSSSTTTNTPATVTTSSNGSTKRQRNNDKNSKDSNNIMTNNVINSNNSNKSSGKDDIVIKLEGEIKKLRTDLHQSKQIENELRLKLNHVTSGDKEIRAELHALTCNNEQLYQDKENLQSKLSNLLSAMQQEKQCISSLKKEIQEEKKVKASLELQLNNERKVRQKAERNAALSSLSSSPDHQNDVLTAPSSSSCSKSSSSRSSQSSSISPVTNNLCTNGTTECLSDSCKSKRKDLEGEMNNLRRQIELRDERLRQYEREVQTLRQYKDTQSDTQYLKSAFSAMQEKTQHLENSLSAETRLKLDLFSALGDAKRQLEITRGKCPCDRFLVTLSVSLSCLSLSFASLLPALLINPPSSSSSPSSSLPPPTLFSRPLLALLSKKDEEIDELRSKIAEVMAVMPSAPSSYSPMVESSLVSSILFNSANCKYIHSDAASNSMNNGNSNGSHLESALSKVLCEANGASLYSPVPSDL